MPALTSAESNRAPAGQARGLRAAGLLMPVLFLVVPMARAGDAAGEVPSCGARGSDPVSPVERAARRLAVEARLEAGEIPHCGYNLMRACLEWESGPAGAAWLSFDRASRVCDSTATAWRGKVAARLDREDFIGAFADWKEGTERGGADSAAVAPYGPAVFAGLSMTDFPARGPVELRLPRPEKDPGKAYLLSAVPGAGFLYADEPGLALRHFVLGAGITALAAWRVHSGFTDPDHDHRMTAFVDAGAVLFVLWKRYQVGGMREAARLVQTKNRRAGGDRVRSLWRGEEPFRPPGSRAD